MKDCLVPVNNNLRLQTVTIAIEYVFETILGKYYYISRRGVMYFLMSCVLSMQYSFMVRCIFSQFRRPCLLHMHMLPAAEVHGC
jgi:hypothetical protein